MGIFLVGSYPGGNFLGGSFPGWELSGWEFSGWKFSWVGIVQVGLILGANFLWWKLSRWELSGENHPGGNFPGGSFHVIKNANVCPVKLFKKYIDATKSLRGSTTCLFITKSKPYRPASKDTLARWIKSVLHNAGIDMTIFTPHSTRSASTSKATKVSIETVLKTGGWRSMRTFANYYYKQIDNLEMFATRIVM